MTREQLRGILPEITDEQLSSVLDINTSDIGEALKKGQKGKEDVEKSLEKANKTIGDLKSQIGDTENLKKTLADYEQRENDRKLAEEAALKESQLKSRFDAVSQDKQFVNDITRQGIFNEFRTALEDKANEGKGDADILSAVLEGKTDIYKNPNQPPMIPPNEDLELDDVTKEQFAKMGYTDRLKLFKTNPELYHKLKK